MGSSVVNKSQRAAQQSTQPLTAVQCLNIARLSENKGRVKVAKANLGAAQAFDAFLKTTDLLTVFRKSLEDKAGKRLSDQAIRSYSRLPIVFYQAGEVIPSAHEVMVFAFSSQKIGYWVKANGVGHREITAGLDALKEMGLATKEGNGLWRWTDKEAFFLAGEKIPMGLLQALDGYLQSFGAGAERFLVWTLGK